MQTLNLVFAAVMLYAIYFFGIGWDVPWWIRFPIMLPVFVAAYVFYTYLAAPIWRKNDELFKNDH